MKILNVNTNAFSLFLIALCVTPLLSAQEMGLGAPDKSGVVKVVAVVQYAEGKVMKTEPSGVQTEIVYQTPIYEGDRIETARGSVLKFATRTGCTVVMRGEGGAGAPSEKKPWRFRAESLRLICRKEKQAQTFGVANVPVTINDGEVLFLSSPLRAMAIRGPIRVRAQNLENYKLYSVTDPVTETSPQPSDEARRQLNLAEKPPRESTPWPEIKIEKPPTTRLIFGPVFGGDHVIYDVNDLSQKGLNGNGPRIQLHFRTAADHSVIVAATYRETCDTDSNCHGGGSKLGVTSQLEMLLLELGYRYHHDRWWSPFFRFGGGRENAKIGFSTPNGGGGGFSYTSYGYLFYVASATAGIDANLMPKFLSPFGFYMSAEVQAIQSLWRDPARENQNGNNSGATVATPEPYRATTFNVSLGLGIQYQF